ncbi:hypothetical protein QJS04_geneDACA021459 [Acorus gramineus]|uniref:Uncharacterized protein n=1 Tax=Acorus gramineus TaxID=55184 RepID=A0AAV9B9V3_ACOGR|nr:hypothetical protein QJS04_geneDACA021459 [Acorus gramineus]
MENITLSEIAGLGVGALLFCATVAAPKIDSFISSSQRRNLGMCRRCGDLRMIACSNCKGTGLVRNGGPFGFSLLDDLSQSLGDGQNPISSKPCIKCKSKGCFSCTECSNKRVSS